MITPSALPRIEKCVVSEALPHVQSTGAYAEGGLAMHDFLSAPSFEEGLLRLDPVDRQAFEHLPLEEIPAFKPQHYAAEVGFVLNVRTGTAREVARMAPRSVVASFCKDPWDMPGIADVVGLTDDAVVIWDYKRWFGRHLDRAAANWQIRTYGLMAARAYGRSRVVGGLIRNVEDGPWFDRFEMDAIDLDEHEANLRALFASVDEVKRKRAAGELLPPPIEGAHCTYCPAFWVCPAKRVLLSAMVVDAPGTATPTPIERELVPNGLEWTPERAALVHQRITAAKQAISRMEGLLNDYLTAHPVKLPNGKMLGRVERTRESFIAVRAGKVLKEMFGDLGAAAFTAAEVVDRKLPKDALNRALKKFVLPTLATDGKKPKFAPLERELLEAMRKAGAVAVSTYSTIDEFTPTADETLAAVTEEHEQAEVQKALTEGGAKIAEGFEPVPELAEVAS